jgi:hypothetical protein
MKNRLSWILPSLVVLTTGISTASAQTFNFSSLGTSQIVFDGATANLSFAPDSGTGHDFQIGSSSLAGLNGLRGDILGTFHLGTITSSPPIQSAPVTGLGQFVLYDTVPGPALTANIWWVSALSIGTVGALNPNGWLNLNNFSYSGTNPFLQALASNTAGVASVNFPFVPGETLNQLETDGIANPTSFAGSLSAIPEPSSYAALLGGVAFGGMLLRRLRRPILDSIC